MTHPRPPLRVGKAHMTLLSAVIQGDEGLANWIRDLVDTDQVIGDPDRIKALKQRLSEVLGEEA